MADLKTHYMGLELKNPIIIGASNIVTDIDNLKRIEKAGAAAVVYKSLFEEQIQLRTHNKLPRFLASHNSPESIGPGAPGLLETHVLKIGGRRVPHRQTGSGLGLCRYADVDGRGPLAAAHVVSHHLTDGHTTGAGRQYLRGMEVDVVTAGSADEARWAQRAQALNSSSH